MLCLQRGYSLLRLLHVGAHRQRQRAVRVGHDILPALLRRAERLRGVRQQHLRGVWHGLRLRCHHVLYQHVLQLQLLLPRLCAERHGLGRLLQHTADHAELHPEQYDPVQHAELHPEQYDPV